MMTPDHHDARPISRPRRRRSAARAFLAIALLANTPAAAGIGADVLGANPGIVEAAVPDPTAPLRAAIAELDPARDTAHNNGAIGRINNELGRLTDGGATDIQPILYMANHEVRERGFDLRLRTSRGRGSYFSGLPAAPPSGRSGISRSQRLDSLDGDFAPHENVDVSTLHRVRHATHDHSSTYLPAVREPGQAAAMFHVAHPHIDMGFDPSHRTGVVRDPSANPLVEQQGEWLHMIARSDGNNFLFEPQPSANIEFGFPDLSSPHFPNEVQRPENLVAGSQHANTGMMAMERLGQHHPTREEFRKAVSAFAVDPDLPHAADVVEYRLQHKPTGNEFVVQFDAAPDATMSAAQFLDIERATSTFMSNPSSSSVYEHLPADRHQWLMEAHGRSHEFDADTLRSKLDAYAAADAVRPAIEQTFAGHQFDPEFGEATWTPVRIEGDMQRPAAWDPDAGVVALKHGSTMFPGPDGGGDAGKLGGRLAFEQLNSMLAEYYESVDFHAYHAFDSEATYAEGRIHGEWLAAKTHHELFPPGHEHNLFTEAQVSEQAFKAAQHAPRDGKPSLAELYRQQYREGGSGPVFFPKRPGPDPVRPPIDYSKELLPAPGFLQAGGCTTTSTAQEQVEATGWNSQVQVGDDRFHVLASVDTSTSAEGAAASVNLTASATGSAEFQAGPVDLAAHVCGATTIQAGFTLDSEWHPNEGSVSLGTEAHAEASVKAFQDFTATYRDVQVEAQLGEGAGADAGFDSHVYMNGFVPGVNVAAYAEAGVGVDAHGMVGGDAFSITFDAGAMAGAAAGGGFQFGVQGDGKFHIFLAGELAVGVGLKGQVDIAFDPSAIEHRLGELPYDRWKDELISLAGDALAAHFVGGDAAHWISALVAGLSDTEIYHGLKQLGQWVNDSFWKHLIGRWTPSDHWHWIHN